MSAKKGDAAASMHRWTLNSASSLETRIRSASHGRNTYINSISIQTEVAVGDHTLRLETFIWVGKQADLKCIAREHSYPH